MNCRLRMIRAVLLSLCLAPAALLRGAPHDDVGGGASAETPRRPEREEGLREADAAGPVAGDAAATLLQAACAPGISGASVSGTGYVVLQFTATGSCTWTPPSGVTSVGYLVVAGGGGGAGNTNNGGGGGGAGGMLTGAASVSAASYTITVGTGGTGGTGGANGRGGNGGASSLIGTGVSVSAVGGGGGGSSDVAGEETGGTGGSGGGSAMRNTAVTGGLGTVGQGNNGGDSRSRNAGGGGGAGAVGGNATNTVAGNGGDGLTSAITGTSVYYAGGGAGARDTTGGTATGGLGGGGSANGATGGSGVANTGGGGAGAFGATPSGGSGGSGIVVLRYALPAPTAQPATLMGRTSLTANWSTVTHATSYRLDVATNVGFTEIVTGYNNLNVGDSASWPVTGLEPGRTYYYRVRAVLGGATSPSSGTITTGTASTFTISGSTSQTAGTAQSLTITAYTPQGLVATGYVGSQNLVFGGANSSTFPVTAPTVTNSTGTAVAFGSSTAITFAAGVATVSGGANGRMVLYLVENAAITATDGAVATQPGTRLPVSVSAAAASQLQVVTQPVGGASGAVLATQPAVAVRDPYGNRIEGDSTTVVTVALASGAGGQVQGTLTATAASGTASFAGVILVGSVSETYTLGFTAPSLGGTASAGVTVTAGAPAQLTMTVQPSGSVANGAVLSQQPVLQVRDSAGNAVAQAGIAVSAAIASGGGTLGGTASRASDAAGQVSFTDLAITGVIGTRTIGFTSAGLAGTVSSGIAVTAGSAVALSLSVQPSSAAQAGVAFSVQPRVQLADVSGNAVAQAGVSVSAAIASGGGVLNGVTTASTGASGEAVFTNLAIADLVGDHTLAFSSAGLTPVTSATITISSGPPAVLALTTSTPATAVNAAVFTQAPVVQLRDAFGNDVAQAGVTVTAAIASGGGSLGGTLSVSTNASGAATFANLAVTGLVGDRTLSFTAAGYAGALSPAIALTPGADASLGITVAPSTTARSGQVLAVQPQVRVYDVSGNQTASVRDISVVLASGTGTIGGTTTVATVAGLATFTNLSMTGTAGSYALRFTSTPLAAALSGTISLTAGVATRVTLATPPSSAVTSGVAFPVQPTVQLRDAAGNAVSEGGIAITAAIASGGGTLGGTVTASTSGAGLATFTDLRITGLIGDRTLVFSSAGLASATSGTVSVAPGAAAQVSIATQPPSSAASGVALGVSPVVQLRDGSGNAVAQAGVSVTVSLESGDPVLGGALSRQTDAGGRAVFDGLTLTGPIGSRTLRFSATGLTAAVSNVVSVSAGAVSGLIITRQPSSLAQVAVPFGQQPLVRLVDVSGNPVSQSGVAITVSLGSGTGTLEGTRVQVTAADGVATFTDVSISGAVGSHTLSFSASGLSAVSSSPILLTDTAPPSLSLTVQPSATARSGQVLAQQPVVQLRDAAGGALAQAGVAVSAAIASGGGVLGGSTVVATDAAGRAVFSGLSITGLLGVRTLSFTATGFDATTSAAITLTCDGCAYLGLTRQPSPSAESGVPLAVGPVVQQLDGLGNPLTTERTITVELASGTGVLTGTLARVTTAGAAAFPDLAITGPPGEYTLRFSAPSLPSVTSDVIRLGAGTASQLALLTQPSSSAISGQAFAVQPVVQLRDASGSSVPQAGVLVTAAVATGNGTLAGSLSVTTDSTGRAAFSGLRIDGGAGDHTLRFSSAGLGSVDSSTVRVSGGAPSRLGLAQQPTPSAVSGVALSVQPEVQLQDSRGAPARWAGVPVTAAVALGGGTLGGTVTVTTDAAGVAAFSTLVLTGTAGTHRLQFSSPDLTAVTSNAIRLGAAGASALGLARQPSSLAQSGVVLFEQPAVQVVDPSGNAVAVAGVAVSAALASGGGALSGGLTATTDSAGVATFSTLTLSGSDGDRTLQFTAAGLSGVVSAPITVGSTAPNRLAVTTQPSGAQPSQVMGTQPVVQLVDSAGVPILQAGVVVSAALGAGGGTLTMSGGGAPAATTDAGGTARFAGLTVSGAAGPRTLRFTAPGYSSVTSAPFDLTCSACAYLALTTAPPAVARSGMVISPAPVVQQYESSGTPASDARVIVASLAHGAGTLSGTTSVTSANGSARFDNLVITGGAGSYALRFSSAPLVEAVSDFLTVTVGTATQLSLGTQPPLTAGSGIRLVPQPAVRLLDASGNVVTRSEVPVTVALASGSGTLEGTLTASTDATGTATFTDLSVTGRGVVTLSFSSPGLSGTVSNGMQLVASGADVGITQSITPTAATIGQVVTLKVTASNTGPDSATALDVGLVLPTGLLLRSVALSQGGYDADTGRWAIGTLRAGASAVATLRAEVTAPGELASVAVILRHDEHDLQHFNDISLVTLNGDGFVDLSVSHLVDYETPRVGDSVRFTTVVTNSGTAAAPQVVVRQAAAAALGASTVTVSQGQFNAGTDVWTAGRLEPGASATLTRDAVMASAAPTVSEAAVVGAGAADLNSANDRDALAVNGGGGVMVAVSAMALRPTSVPFEPAPVLVLVHNEGPAEATELVVDLTAQAIRVDRGVASSGALVLTDTAGARPAGDRAAAGRRPGADESSVAIGTWTVPSLRPHESATLALEGLVTAAGAAGVDARLRSVRQPDLFAGDDAARASVAVPDATGQACADVSLAMTTPSFVVAGSVWSLRTTTVNVGPGYATDIETRLVIPRGTSLRRLTPSAGGECSTTAVSVTCVWPGSTLVGRGGARTIDAVFQVGTDLPLGTLLPARAQSTSVALACGAGTESVARSVQVAESSTAVDMELRAAVETADGFAPVAAIEEGRLATVWLAAANKGSRPVATHYDMSLWDRSVAAVEQVSPSRGSVERGPGEGRGRWYTGVVAPGETVYLRLLVRMTGATSTRLTAERVGGTLGDPVPDNDQASVVLDGYRDSPNAGRWAAAGRVRSGAGVEIVTGTGEGDRPQVRIFTGDGADTGVRFLAFDPAFTGGVRVVACDLDRDGLEEVVAAQGPGGSRVRVFHVSETRVGEVASFLPFEEGFGGGVTVSCADTDGDQRSELVVGAGPGRAAEVRVFQVSSGRVARVAQWEAYPGFTGGVQVAASAHPGNGFVGPFSVVTLPGPGMPADLRGWRLGGGTAELVASVPAVFGDDVAGGHLAVGDLDGDQTVDLMLAPTRASPLLLRAYSLGDGRLLGDVGPGGGGFGGAVRTMMGDFEVPGIGRPELVVSGGARSAPEVHVYLYTPAGVLRRVRLLAAEEP